MEYFWSTSCRREATVMVDSVDNNKGDQEAWHRRLLPFMMSSLIVMGLLFFVLTVWQFRDLQSRLTMRPVDIEGALQRAQTQSGQRDWYLRVVLEEAALRHRYEQNATIVQARVWTRYMGFLTGMILALTGCVFVLGKLREEVSVSGKASGIEANLTTASPGVVLALAGAVLIGVSLWVPVTVESNDVPVYLPRQIELTPPTGTVDTRPAPSSMPPAQTGDAKADRKGATVPKGTPPMPPSVLEKLKECPDDKKCPPSGR
jgi:hypothetical protein